MPRISNPRTLKKQKLYVFDVLRVEFSIDFNWYYYRCQQKQQKHKNGKRLKQQTHAANFGEDFVSLGVIFGPFFENDRNLR